MNDTTKNNSVAIILERDGKISMSFRLHTRTFPFVWAFAGGSIETGETEVETAKRETLEETGLNIDVDRFKYLGNCYEGGQFCAIFKVELHAFEEPRHVEKDKRTDWYWFLINDVFKLKTMPGISEVMRRNYVMEM